MPGSWLTTPTSILSIRFFARSGIGNVQVFGAGQYAMRLWVKPDTLAKLGITVPEIVSAIQAQNTVNPAGQSGRRACSKGPGIHLLGPGSGAPRFPEPATSWLAIPGGATVAWRRCPHRTGRARLQRCRSFQRQARRHYCSLPIARLQRSRCWPASRK